MTLTRVFIPGMVDPVDAMRQVLQGDKAGYVDMRPLSPRDFRPVVAVPERDYWLDGVDLGGDLLNMAPARALTLIEASGRSPLTLEEGVTIAVTFPGILRAENCFQMLGSSAGDRRVPSLWVASDGRPRLGWCWRGNPHSWLGAASCQSRGPVA